MTREIAFATFRHVLTAAGPVIALQAGMNPADVEAIAGAAMTLIGFGLSIADKVRNRRRRR